MSMNYRHLNRILRFPIIVMLAVTIVFSLLNYVYNVHYIETKTRLRDRKQVQGDISNHKPSGSKILTNQELDLGTIQELIRKLDLGLNLLNVNSGHHRTRHSQTVSSAAVAETHGDFMFNRSLLRSNRSRDPLPLMLPDPYYKQSVSVQKIFR